MSPEAIGDMYITICGIRNKVNNIIEKHEKLTIEQKAVLQQAEKVLVDSCLEANSGNEMIFLAYSSLKELALKLNEMGKM